MVLTMIVVLGAGCVRGYTLKVTNLLDTTVVIEFSQYHAKDFSRTRPQEFTRDLHENTRKVTLGPGEKAEVVFVDATGGFWVTWRQIEPVAGEPLSGVLDLTRDRLKITIESVSKNGR